MGGDPGIEEEEMMSWNYRIFRHRHGPGDTTYALHEAYYNEKGKCDGWTKEAITSHGFSVKELIDILEMMLNDAKKCRRDILEYEPKRTTKKTRKNAARKGKKG